MYFENRTSAGDMLAARLVNKYAGEECAVIALSEGGVVVGAQVAFQLGSVLMYVIHETIEIPGESLDIGSVDELSGFTHNGELAQVEIEGYTNEFHGYIEEEKRKAASRINKNIGSSDIWDGDILVGKNIILIDDGIRDHIAIDVAMNLLKPINTKKIIICAPVVDANAVDHLHVIADELLILDVRANFLDIDHYYTDNSKPSVKDAIGYVSKIVADWR